MYNVYSGCQIQITSKRAIDPFSTFSDLKISIIIIPGNVRHLSTFGTTVVLPLQVPTSNLLTVK